METQTNGAGPSRLRDLSTNLELYEVRKAEHPAATRPSEKVLQWYTELVEDHLRAIIRHREGMDYRDGQALQDTSDWLGWTPRDQSCFFAALSRHSRLRADLVAEDCGKPESEVLLYLDSLDNGLAKVLQADQSDQDGRRNRGRREGNAKSAREMTENWIQEEERLAGYILQDERGADRMEEGTQLSKRRRIERSEMRAELRVKVEDKCRRRQLREHQSAQLESRYAMEDWGRAMDWQKLEQVNKLTRPSWSEWYRDRVRQTPAPRSRAVSLLAEDVPASPGATQSIGKHAKIAIDNATIARIQALDKSARSAEQRADLTKLLNRKRNRENTRMQSLSKMGKSAEDIENEGGVDKAYLKSIGKDIEAETPTETMKSVMPTLPSTPLRLGSRKKPTSRQGTPMDFSTVSEEDPALQDLRDMGLDTYLYEENLDIINFAALASQYTGPDIPLTILYDIVGTIKQHLRQLILQSILLAEIAAIQEGLDLTKQEIESQHVESVLAAFEGSQKDGMRVSLYPRNTEEATLADENESDGEDDSSRLTDQEDNDLDDAMTNVDEKLDSTAELSLWQAAEELSLPELSPDDIIAARSAYRALQASVGTARRHRHSMKRRSTLFPSTGFRRPSRLKKKKVAKSAAYIENSEDELVEDDVELEKEGDEVDYESEDDMLD